MYSSLRSTISCTLESPNFSQDLLLCFTDPPLPPLLPHSILFSSPRLFHDPTEIAFQEGGTTEGGREGEKGREEVRRTRGEGRIMEEARRGGKKRGGREGGREQEVIRVEKGDKCKWGTTQREGGIYCIVLHPEIVHRVLPGEVLKGLWIAKARRRLKAYY